VGGVIRGENYKRPGYNLKGKGQTERRMGVATERWRKGLVHFWKGGKGRKKPKQ